MSSSAVAHGEDEHNRPCEADDSNDPGVFSCGVEASAARPVCRGAVSGSGRPSRDGRSTGAPALAPLERSCQATLSAAVTSSGSPPDNSTVRRRYIAGQQPSRDKSPTPPEHPCHNGDAAPAQACPNERAEVASLPPTAHDMCGPRLDHAPGAYESSPEQFEQYVDSIMEGLTAQTAIPIPPDVAFDPFDEGDAPPELVCEYLKARSRWGLPQGLVIQSNDPELYPHIVITPPPYTSFENYCPCGHCSYDTPSLPPQLTELLAVPPRRDEGMVRAAYPWREGEAECNPVPQGPPDESFPSDRTDVFGQPRRVFSPSLFRQSADKAAQERLVFDHVITAIHRRCYRLVAVHASVLATSFRARWDSDLFCRQIERPFKWTDPAEPLLSAFYHDPNALVLDSVDPLLAPHIVIHEAPEQDLRTLDNVFVPPQCCYSGFLLTHPIGCSGSCCYYAQYSAPPVLELSLPDPALPPLDLALLAEVEGIEFVDDDSSEASTDASDSDGSDASSDTLVTPTRAAHADVLLKEPLPPALDARFCIDEDEDALPPFDDWYQTIARRAIN